MNSHILDYALQNRSGSTNRLNLDLPANLTSLHPLTICFGGRSSNRFIQIREDFLTQAENEIFFFLSNQCSNALFLSPMSCKLSVFFFEGLPDRLKRLLIHMNWNEEISCLMGE